MSKNNPQQTTSTNQPSPVGDSDTLVIAKPMVRLMAVVYDGMLILASLFLVGTILSVIGTILLMDVGETAQQAKRLPLWYQNGVMTPAFVLTLVGFYGLFWRKSGQTLGMQTWRLQTVTSSGQLLTWGQSFRRIVSACLLPLLCATIGGVFYGSRLSILMSAFLGFLCNYLFCVFNRQGLSAHDILSNTMTLKIPKHQHASIFEKFKRK